MSRSRSSARCPDRASSAGAVRRVPAGHRMTVIGVGGGSRAAGGVARAAGLRGFGVARGLGTRWRGCVRRRGGSSAGGVGRQAAGARGGAGAAASGSPRARVELAGVRDVGGGLAELADALAERRRDVGQLAGAEHDERDDQDQDQLAGADVGTA